MRGEPALTLGHLCPSPSSPAWKSAHSPIQARVCPCTPEMTTDGQARPWAQAPQGGLWYLLPAGTGTGVALHRLSSHLALLSPQGWLLLCRHLFSGVHSFQPAGGGHSLLSGAILGSRHVLAGVRFPHLLNPSSAFPLPQSLPSPWPPDDLDCPGPT